jgi:hypothetical protein
VDNRKAADEIGHSRGGGYILFVKHRGSVGRSGVRFDPTINGRNEHTRAHTHPLFDAWLVQFPFSWDKIFVAYPWG